MRTSCGEKAGMRLPQGEAALSSVDAVSSDLQLLALVARLKPGPGAASPRKPPAATRHRHSSTARRTWPSSSRPSRDRPWPPTVRRVACSSWQGKTVGVDAPGNRRRFDVFRERGDRGVGLLSKIECPARCCPGASTAHTVAAGARRRASVACRVFDDPVVPRGPSGGPLPTMAHCRRLPGDDPLPQRP